MVSCDELKTKLMDIEQILNDALNKALITDRIKGVPSSNKIADFVSKYVETEQLTIHSVVVNEAVKLYEPCKKGKETMCKCNSDQDCRDQSEEELCQCKGMRSYMAKPKGRFCLKCDKYIWHN